MIVVSDEVLVAHLEGRLLPAGFVPVIRRVFELLELEGWASGTVIPLPDGLPPMEAALWYADGSQGICVIDAARSLGLLPLLPDRFAWIGRHPSWGR